METFVSLLLSSYISLYHRTFNVASTLYVGSVLLRSNGLLPLGQTFVVIRGTATVVV